MKFKQLLDNQLNEGINPKLIVAKLNTELDKLVREAERKFNPSLSDTVSDLETIKKGFNKEIDKLITVLARQI